MEEKKENRLVELMGVGDEKTLLMILNKNK